MESSSKDTTQSQLKNTADLFQFGSSISIPKSDIQSLLGKFRKVAQEELGGKIEYSEEKGIFVLGNGNKDVDYEILLQIMEKGNSIQLIWGPKVKANIIKSLMHNIIEIIDTDFPLFSGAVLGFDYKKFFDIEFAGNHYDLISKSFYRQSSLFKIFPTEKRFDNDIAFRGVIDENRVSLIQIVGGTTRSEVIDQEFKEKRLRVIVGLGQMSGILSQNLERQIFKHMKIWEDVFKNGIKSNVIDVLNDEIASILSE